MWMMVALVMSLALFALLSLTHMEQDQNAVYQTALSAMETRSASQMDTFTSAAWAYATANNVSTGATISVAQLISAGYLPTAFTASNPFGQTLVALTGNYTLAAYYQNPPNSLYGMPVVHRTETGVAMKMAEKLSAMQENAPEYVAAVSYNGGSGNTYNQALLPYAVTALTMSTNDPQFRTIFPSLLDMVNVLPATALESGSGGATAPTTSSVCDTQSFTTPGTVQVTVPSCAVSETVVAIGAGGGGSDVKYGGNGSSVTGTIPVTANATETVVVGGGGTGTEGSGDTSVGAGGGGLSAVCNGTGCSSSSALVVAGGGGGAGYAASNGGNAGTLNQSAGSADGGSYSGGNGGYGFGGYGNDAYNYYGTAGTPFAAGGSGNNSGGYGATGNGGYGGGGGGGSGDDGGGGGGGGGFPGGGGSGTGPSIGGYGGQGGEDYTGSAASTSIGNGASGGAPLTNGSNGSVSITFYS